MSTDKYQKAMQRFSQVHGGAATAEEGIKELAKVSPRLAQFCVEWIFGDIYSSSVLDLKTRELLTLAACVASGDALPQVKNHVRGALNVGCSQEEIRETILQMLIIKGFPSVVNAMLAAQEVFSEG